MFTSPWSSAVGDVSQTVSKPCSGKKYRCFGKGSSSVQVGKGVTSTPVLEEDGFAEAPKGQLPQRELPLAMRSFDADMIMFPLNTTGCSAAKLDAGALSFSALNELLMF